MHIHAHRQRDANKRNNYIKHTLWSRKLPIPDYSKKCNSFSPPPNRSDWLSRRSRVPACSVIGQTSRHSFPRGVFRILRGSEWFAFALDGDSYCCITRVFTDFQPLNELKREDVHLVIISRYGLKGFSVILATYFGVLDQLVFTGGWERTHFAIVPAFCVRVLRMCVLNCHLALWLRITNPFMDSQKMK